MKKEEKARILLVDDEPDLVKFMGMYLSKIGYSVDSGANASEGFALAQNADPAYDLLVADLSLPDMPGQDMAIRLVEKYPQLRVLLCSGYPFAVDSLPEAVQPRFDALLKPFAPKELAKSLEDLLKRKID